ncbi:sulfate permease [bacterium]|nr:MAG: sulfate permease [bacterium]
MWPTSLLPKTWTVVLRAKKYTGASYSKETFLRDLIAGIVVGIVALPLAIAFGIASGVTPEQGLATAIIAGFLISFLGGSRYQIGGPTGAFIVIIYGIVTRYGYDGLAVATMMAGVLLMVMGFARLGAIIQYIPYPVTVGFTSGIALIIFSGQIRDLFGLPMKSVPPEFVEKWEAYSTVLDKIDPLATAIGIGTVILVFLWPKVSRRVPGAFVAVIVTTIIVKVFDLPVETIGSRFGGVSASLPMPKLPQVSLAQMRELVSPAVTIALLAGIESLLSAVVADGMTGKRHRSNVELVAQGVANFVSPIFGGIPATGAIARTATNVRNGGETPVAGIIHAFVILIILLFFGKWAALIPMATLAGILVVVSYHMSEWHSFVKTFKSPKSDVAVLLITFALTLLVDLTVAIQVGVVLAALLFMKRMADVSQAGFVDVNEQGELEEKIHSDLFIPKEVTIYKIRGPFFFGASEKLTSTLGLLQEHPRVLILNMRMVPAMDATGLNAMEDILKKTKKQGTLFLLFGLQQQPRGVLEKGGLLETIGSENILPDLKAALARAEHVKGAS